MRMRTALFLSFLFATMVPLSVYSFWSYSKSVDQEFAEVEDRHLLLAQNLSAALERYHTDVSATFESVSLAMQVNSRPMNLEGLMKSINLWCVIIIDPRTGVRLAITDAKAHVHTDYLAATDLKDLYVKSNATKTVFSPVTHIPGVGNAFLITRRVGNYLALGVVDTSYIVRLGKSISFGVKGHAAIVDSVGNVLSHPLDSWIEARKNISKVSAVKRMMNGETGIEQFYSPALKGDMIAGLTQVKGPKWGVMIPQPVVELYDKARRNQIGLVVVVAICFLIALMLAYLFVNSLALPMERFLATMKGNARLGKLSKNEVKESFVPIQEMSQFRENYNFMVESVGLANEKLEELAYTDNLTGLPNRARLEQLALPMLKKAEQSGESGCLIFLDLDNFKEINDLHGHRRGDEFLKEQTRKLIEVTKLMALRSGNNDGQCKPIVSRIGGDEFVILFPSTCTSIMVERFLNLLNRYLRIPTPEFRNLRNFGASIGCAQFPQDGTTLEALLKKADIAMYHAKTSGKNQACFYNATAGDLTIAELRQRVEKAIELNELVLEYQPKVDAETFEVRGYEALVRWDHPEKGRIAPNVWIPAITGTQILNKLGEWVVQRAMEDHARWREQGREIRIAVNIGADHFASKGFASWMSKMAKQHDMDPACFEIEITEDALFSGGSNPEAVLKKLQRAGFWIAIDDFGTGYSNIARLSTLTFNCLKIDRSVIVKAQFSKRGRAIVQCITAMAKELGCRVVAEGVETRRIVTVASNLGVHTLQGFYFSKSLPADEVLDWRVDARKSPKKKPAKSTKKLSKAA